MSRKSRQRKGKADAEAAAPAQPVAVPAVTATVETRRPGIPFGVVVLFAAVMSIPTILAMVEDTMSFDAGVTRLLIALAVAWLLTNLVYSVVDGMRPDVDEVELELTTPPTTPYEMPGEPGPGYAAPAGDDEEFRATGT